MSDFNQRAYETEPLGSRNRSYSKEEAAQVPNQWWDFLDLFRNVPERRIENPYDYDWAKRPEQVEANYAEDGSFISVPNASFTSMPVPRYTREGVLYYTTRKDTDGTSSTYGQPIPDVKEYNQNRPWYRSLPYGLGGEKQGDISDYALASFIFNEGPSVAAPFVALKTVKPQTQNIVMKGKYEQQVTIPLNKQGLKDARTLNNALSKDIDTIQNLSRFNNKQSKGVLESVVTGMVTKDDPVALGVQEFDQGSILGMDGQPYALQSTTGGSGNIARDKAGRPISPAEQVKEDILQGIIPEPTIEQLEMAIRGGGAQNRAGWIYNRSRVQGFPPSLRDRLLSEYGGTPELAEQFRKEQLAHKRYMDTKVIPQMNEEARLGYLIFFSTAREIGGRDLPEFTTDMTWENEVFKMYMRFLASPSGSAVYDLGHVQAAKNIDLYNKPGQRTTADFASNLEPEMKRSMKDFIMKEAPDGNLMRAGEKRKINDWEQDLVALRVAEPGNIKRKNLQDLPRLLNLFRNINPNVELEYIRFLSKHGYDAERDEYHEDAPNYDEVLTDIIDPMEQEALLAHVRKYILKRQRNIKNKSGAKQLKLYPKWLRAGINSYMNTRYKTKAQLDVEHESGQTIDAADKEAKIWAEQQAERGRQVLQEDLSIKEALKDMPSEKQMEGMIDNWLEDLRPEDMEDIEE